MHISYLIVKVFEFRFMLAIKPPFTVYLYLKSNYQNRILHLQVIDRKPFIPEQVIRYYNNTD